MFPKTGFSVSISSSTFYSGYSADDASRLLVPAVFSTASRIGLFLSNTEFPYIDVIFFGEGVCKPVFKLREGSGVVAIRYGAAAAYGASRTNSSSSVDGSS